MEEPSSWRSALARRLRADLQEHVINCWFPRSVDTDHGGFLCDFDERWRADGAQQRMLEFQARQTRGAARLGVALPAQERWSQTALHGLDYLRTVMLDGQEGGLFWLVDRNGTPLAHGTKHGHSTAYAIGAAAQVHRLTHAPEALALARHAFDWVEEVLHDDVNGGYYGWATREGRPILKPDDTPPPVSLTDPLGHGLGLKDANVHGDLLEAYAQLHDVWPDERLRKRQAELYELITHRFATPAGSMHYLLYPDLTPVPGIERFGYPLQTAARLRHMADHSSVTPAAAADVCRALLTHTIKRAWNDLEAGFVEAGPATEPNMLSGVDQFVRLMPWWLQAEGVVALLWSALDSEHGGEHHVLLERLLALIDSDYLDHRHGGWYPTARSGWSRWTRLTRRGIRKGDLWKDASHETDMYLTAIRLLRGVSANEPIDESAE